MALPSFNVRVKDRSMRTVQRMEYNDRLIAAVHKRPILWDCGRSDHKDYRKKHTVWMEVLREVGKDPEGSTVQARWKGLRDTFVKKHKTWAATTSNGTIEGCKEVRWPYFKLLMFLKDQADVFGDVTSNTEPNEEPQEDASSILLHICNDSEETGMVSSGDEDE
ncbi:transcription factor Adf-1-like isoform X2 [Amblyomma americanum]